MDGRTYRRTYGRTDIFSPSNIVRSTFGSRPNNKAFIIKLSIASCYTVYRVMKY